MTNCPPPGERPIAAVLLDVGGVFHLPDHDVLSVALGHPLSADDVFRAHFHGVAVTIDFGGRDRDIWTAYNFAFAAEIGRPDLTDHLYDVFESTPALWTSVIPGSAVALRDLAATGVGLAIVSNSDGTLEGRLRAEALCQVGAGNGIEVAIVCDSGECGVSKPDPAIFRLALDALGVDPADALHVGDTFAADVVGARAAGVTPIHVDPLDLCALDDHAHVVSLADVVDLVIASRA